MLITMLTFEQQRTRFEKHHKKLSPIAYDYTHEDNGFADPYINGVFLGWSMAVQCQREDEVNLHYDHIRGWTIVSAYTGFNVVSPEFKPYSKLDEAVEWAKENGLILSDIDD